MTEKYKCLSNNTHGFMLRCYTHVYLFTHIFLYLPNKLFRNFPKFKTHFDVFFLYFHVKVNLRRQAEYGHNTNKTDIPQAQTQIDIFKS